MQHTLREWGLVFISAFGYGCFTQAPLTGTAASAANATNEPSARDEAPAQTAKPSPETAPPMPPAKGAFETGIYRNMFLERGYEQAAVCAKINAAYEQLFHGNADKERLMYDAGDNRNGALAYILNIGDGDVRSEGMSYGMMIAVQMNRKKDFDALWNWARTYMYHDDPKHPSFGYFSWQMKRDGTPIDEMSAPDGEAHFITALFFAAHRWGDGDGIYDYSRHATTLLDMFKNRKAVTGEKTADGKLTKTTGTAEINAEYKMVRFTPDTSNFKANGDHTNPSYHLPAFYELWALWGPEKDQTFWHEAAQLSRDYIAKVAHPQTGLTPDYASYDGKPVSASFNPDSIHFRWDAWRTAANWALDYHWFAKDDRQKALTRRLHAFFAAQGIKNYRQLYTLDGKPFGGDEFKKQAPGLVAANGAAALASADPSAWQFVDAVWKTEVPTGTWRYYDGMLYMLGLLQLSGNYRIYAPTGTSAQL